MRVYSGIIILIILSLIQFVVNTTITYQLDPQPQNLTCVVHFNLDYDLQEIFSSTIDQILIANTFKEDDLSIFVWTVRVLADIDNYQQRDLFYTFSKVERCSINIMFKNPNTNGYIDSYTMMYYGNSKWITPRSLHNAFIVVAKTCKGSIIDEAAYSSPHRLFFYFETCENRQLQDTFPNAVFYPSRSEAHSIIFLQKNIHMSVHDATIPKKYLEYVPVPKIIVERGNMLVGEGGNTLIGERMQPFEANYITSLSQILNFTCLTSPYGSQPIRGAGVIIVSHPQLFGTASSNRVIFKYANVVVYCKEVKSKKPESEISVYDYIHNSFIKLMLPFDSQVWLYSLLSVLFTAFVCSINLPIKKSNPKRSSFIRNFEGNTFAAFGSILLQQRVPLIKKRIIPLAFGSIVLSSVYQDLIVKESLLSPNVNRDYNSVYGLVYDGYKIAYQSRKWDFVLRYMHGLRGEELVFLSQFVNFGAFLKTMSDPKNKLALMVAVKEGETPAILRHLQYRYWNLDWRYLKLFGNDENHYTLFRTTHAEQHIQITDLLYEHGFMLKWKNNQKYRKDVSSRYHSIEYVGLFVRSVTFSRVSSAFILGGLLLGTAFLIFQAENVIYYGWSLLKTLVCNKYRIDKMIKSINGNFLHSVRKYRSQNYVY